MDGGPADVDRIEIIATLDRVAAEALRLEILQLARRSGVKVGEVRIRRLDDDETPPTSR
jgi:hypothetical protein